LPLRNKDP